MRRGRNRVLIERAVARGELAPDVDGDAILDEILGLVLAWMGTGGTPSEREVEQRASVRFWRKADDGLADLGDFRLPASDKRP
jgi:hypothetical protein